MDTKESVLERIKDNHGYLTSEDIEFLIENCFDEFRLENLIVKSERIICMVAIQYVKFLIESLEKNGDYVRQISFQRKLK